MARGNISSKGKGKKTDVDKAIQEKAAEKAEYGIREIQDRLNKSSFMRDLERFGASIHRKLAKHVLQMIFHRVLGHVERAGDLLV